MTAPTPRPEGKKICQRAKKRERLSKHKEKAKDHLISRWCLVYPPLGGKDE